MSDPKFQKPRLQGLNNYFIQAPDEEESTKKMLRQFEGFRDKAYRDTAGKWTVGYGRTGPDVGPGTTTTREDEEEWLGSRVKDTEMAFLERHGLPKNAALASAVYNMGATGFKRSQLYNLAKEGRWEEFANELQKYDKDSKGNQQEGLTKRRIEEANYIRSTLGKKIKQANEEDKTKVIPPTQVIGGY